MLKKHFFLYAATILLSLFIGVFLVELAWKFTQKQPDEIGQRYYLISGSNGVFKNVHNIFLYEKHSSIKHRVWFAAHENFEKGYSYEFRTNNFGLAQDFDISNSKESMLILGDSFTEGTGAPPWFNEFAKRFPDKHLQLVNGGILGTGFLHWVGLDEYLRNEGFKFSKAIVIFISDDVSRKRWTLPSGILRCLKNWRSCEGWENFLAIPPAEEELGFLRKVRDFRMRSTYVESNIKESLKNLLPGTTEAYRNVVRMISRQASEEAVVHLKELYGENIAFVHIPLRHELDFGFDNDGIAAQKMINKAGGKIFDGRASCGFEPGDYYGNDQHFNQRGYRKLSECILKIYAEWQSDAKKIM